MGVWKLVPEMFLRKISKETPGSGGSAFKRLLQNQDNTELQIFITSMRLSYDYTRVKRRSNMKKLTESSLPEALQA